MKKFVVPVIVVMVLGYLGWHGVSRAEKSASDQATPAQTASGPEVVVRTMQEQDVRLTSELPGRTTVYEVAEIRPQVSGIVKKRAFEEGTEVKSGQVLYQIDPDTYAVAVARAAAAVARAKAELEPARLKAERYADLIKTKAVSQQDHDDALAAFALAKASVASAEAELDAARIDLERTKVVAPIAGCIGRSSVTAGALVTANQAEPLATVRQLDPMYVDLTQSNVDLLRLRRSLERGEIRSADQEGASVRLMLEDGSPYALAGTLKLAEASVDQGTGTVTLRAVFPNPKRELLPGMYVRALVEEGVMAKAVLIPQQAVSRNAQGDPLALVVDARNTVVARPLELGRAVGGDWIVRAGLRSGERVVVEGFQKVRPGMQVRVVQDSK